ncbi:hypothetical protein PAMP_002117 [Pampus punctatissimus]
MRHFPSDTNNPYVTSAQKTIEACSLEKSSVTYQPFITSSERPILPVSTSDRTTADNYVRPPGTIKASPPPSIPASDKETSGIVEVKARKKFFNRISCFFSRMMIRISSCSGDVVEPFKCSTPHFIEDK